VVDDAPRILAGRYEVGELIGRGGMAEVHIGHDNRLGRTVAIKILRSDLARDPSFQARFRREAQAAASLNHPAIVAVYDTGEDSLIDPATGAASHVPFIVMEYVEGHTVRDILQGGNAVPIEEAVEITQGVLAALDYSHRAGIVHRDIKPANVMLTPTGAVKVMDFGIARALADSAATMTQTQAVIGTAQYLSPEQARGETVDARSDIYSTGCLLFELLTGRPPFQGDSPVSVAYQHVRENAPAPSSIASDVPEVLDRVTAKALAKDRDARYSSAAEFRADLDAAMRGGHVTAAAVPLAAAAAATQVFSPLDAGAATQVMAQPTTGATPAWGPVAEDEEPEEEPEKSHKALIWTIVGVAVAAVVALVLILTLGGGDDTPPPATTVTMPVVAGLTEDTAKAELVTAGITSTPTITTEASTEVEAGLVISSDPEAGQTLEPADPVTLVVSGGPSALTVDDVSGLSQAQAVQQLTEQGLEVNATRMFEDSPDVPKDKVTRTDPEAGASAKQGDTVTIYVSTGFVTVDDLTGKKQAAACKALQDLKLSCSTETVETDDAKEGTVVSQSQTGKVEQFSSITLKIAKKPAPKQVTIPANIVGMSEADAQTLLSSLSLQWDESTYESSDTVAAGMVIRTEPGVGTTMTEGQTVHLVISSGPATGSTPTDPGSGDDDQG